MWELVKKIDWLDQLVFTAPAPKSKMLDEQKIKEAFENIKKDILELKESVIYLTKISQDLMESQKSFTKSQGLEVRQEVRELGSQLGSREPQKQPLNSIQKKALRTLDKALLMKTIGAYIVEGCPTNQMRDEIMSRFNIGKTCFFKYLKLVRGQVRGVGSQIGSRT